MRGEQREEQRALFEERAFNQRFLMSIRKVGEGCMTFQAVGCPTKAEFVKRQADGSYEDQTLNAMWWAWCEAVRLNRGAEE
jgi:hypothetical protein